jgi:hypothetical protein
MSLSFHHHRVGHQTESPPTKGTGLLDCAPMGWHCDQGARARQLPDEVALRASTRWVFRLRELFWTAELIAPSFSGQPHKPCGGGSCSDQQFSGGSSWRLEFEAHPTSQARHSVQVHREGGKTMETPDRGLPGSTGGWYHSTEGGGQEAGRQSQDALPAFR